MFRGKLQPSHESRKITLQESKNYYTQLTPKIQNEIYNEDNAQGGNYIHLMNHTQKTPPRIK